MFQKRKREFTKYENTKKGSVKINSNEIPDTDYDLGRSIFASSVKRCFEQPGTKEEYEEWLKSEENSTTV